MSTSTCKHCGKRIVCTNDWAGRPSWTHQHEGASFQDGQHVYCHHTRAEPVPAGCGHDLTGMAPPAAHLLDCENDADERERAALTAELGTLRAELAESEREHQKTLTIMEGALDQRDSARDERDALAAKIEKAEVIHVRQEFGDSSPGVYYCGHCQTTAGLWPCPTIAALADPEDT